MFAGWVARLARLGVSDSRARQQTLDALLAPTAYWWAQRASQRVRERAAAAAAAAEEEEEKEEDTHAAFDRLWERMLLPSGRYEDVFAGWARNDRFRAVARLEFLRARYAGTDTYARAGPGGPLDALALRGSAEAELPTRGRLLETFGMEDWNWDDDGGGGGGGSNNNGRPRAPRRDSSLEDARKFELLRERVGSRTPGVWDLEAPVRLRVSGGAWDLEDVLEIGGCCVHGRSEFNLFAEENELYEVLTSDYVSALAAEVLAVREARRGGSGGVDGAGGGGEPFVVVEVGAGSGALSHHLRKHLADEAGGHVDVDVIATDPGTWKLSTHRHYPVEPYAHAEALRRLGPDLVLVSWMPQGEDWTADFRAGGVPDYIVLGEVDDGCTGHNWLTWGNVDYYEGVTPGGTAGTTRARRPVPPFTGDGYERHDLHGLSRLQLQRYDCKQAPYQSATVRFSKA
jgi:hypothetical protein